MGTRGERVLMLYLLNQRAWQPSFCFAPVQHICLVLMTLQYSFCKCMGPYWQVWPCLLCMSSEGNGSGASVNKVSVCHQIIVLPGQMDPDLFHCLGKGPHTSTPVVIILLSFLDITLKVRKAGRKIRGEDLTLHEPEENICKSSDSTYVVSFKYHCFFGNLQVDYWLCRAGFKICHIYYIC